MEMVRYFLESALRLEDGKIYAVYYRTTFYAGDSGRKRKVLTQTEFIRRFGKKALRKVESR